MGVEWGRGSEVCGGHMRHLTSSGWVWGGPRCLCVRVRACVPLYNEGVAFSCPGDVQSAGGQVGGQCARQHVVEGGLGRQAGRWAGRAPRQHVV